MPQVNDTLDKDELYRKVASNITPKRARKRKRTWLIPSFATVAVICLVVIIAQSMQPSNFGALDNGRSQMDEVSENMEMAQLPTENNENQITTNEAEEGNNDMAIMERAEEEIFTSRVVNAQENTTLIYGAVLDNNANAVIPLTFVVDKLNADVESYYSHLNDYIREEEWGVFAYPFENMTFDINNDNNEVMINVPENYQFGNGGGTVQGLFETVISTMFLPYQLDTAVIDYASSTNQELGMLGNIESFPLERGEQQIYKMYQSSENGASLFVPFNFTGDIVRALEEMRNPQEETNTQASIPADYSFSSIQSNGDELLIQFDDPSRPQNDQQTQDMIEAILLTAKSFGFSSVNIEADVAQVGIYPMNQSIFVPDAVNPVHIR